MIYNIFVINPGSTSTKIALYENDKQIFSDNITHRPEELNVFDKIPHQLEFREKIVRDSLTRHGYSTKDLSAVMGRGGLLPGLRTGGYVVNDDMFEALGSDWVSPHASNLGGMLAYNIAKDAGVPAYIYDAVTSSELDDVARITGIPAIMRQSFCHVLNSRAMAMKYARDRGERYEDINCLVAHMGGGVTVSVHRKGKIIDSLADDDGQFSPERSGSVPLLNLVDLCYSGKYTKEQMKKMVRGKGGMYAHLGTSDCREIEEMIAAGNKKAKLVFAAQAYQIAKGIGLLSPVLKGDIDAIILTGGVAYSKKMTDMVTEYVEFIAPVVVLPGEYEMESLAQGALRILEGKECVREYVKMGNVIPECFRE